MPVKKQYRRSVSMKPEIYIALLRESESTGEPIAALVESAVKFTFGYDSIPTNEEARLELDRRAAAAALEEARS